MTNRKGKWHKTSPRIEMQDISSSRRRKIAPFTSKDYSELSQHLAKRKLLVFESDPDIYKEDR
jgi:hypothetical protein